MSNTKVNQIWDSLIEYWQKNEPNFQGCIGANDKEIEELEQFLKVELPESFKQSLKRCNTVPENYSEIVKSSCLVTGSMGDLHSIPFIKEIFADRLEYYYMDDMEYAKNVDPSIKPLNLKGPQLWIPIYNWNGNEWALLDLNEESNQYGQILYDDPEFGNLGIWANSYEDLLESIANAILDHGEYNRDDFINVRNKVIKTISSR